VIKLGQGGGGGTKVVGDVIGDGSVGDVVGKPLRFEGTWDVSFKQGAPMSSPKCMASLPSPTTWTFKVSVGKISLPAPPPDTTMKFEAYYVDDTPKCGVVFSYFDNTNPWSVAATFNYYLYFDGNSLNGTLDITNLASYDSPCIFEVGGVRLLAALSWGYGRISSSSYPWQRFLRNGWGA